MKKFTGRYTTNTAKALKGSERILCQVSEDGTIYICNGFLLCTMNAPEYAATAGPGSGEGLPIVPPRPGSAIAGRPAENSHGPPPRVFTAPGLVSW